MLAKSRYLLSNDDAPVFHAVFQSAILSVFLKIQFADNVFELI